MAKKSSKKVASAERRARAEALRREQERQERRRTLLIVGVCAVLVVGLLAAAVIPYVKSEHAKKQLAATPLQKVGVGASAAGCAKPIVRTANGNNVHKPVGTTIDYPYAPPAFGPHWGNFLYGSELRNFYTVKDRPQLERVVHSLEHGHTLVWYDDTVEPGSASYRALQQIGDKLPASAYFMAVPWESSDGGAMPAGKHIAITHWTGPSDQKGVWVYCSKTSGSVIKDFMQKYPKTDTPEVGAA